VTATKNGTADEVFGGDSSLTVIGDADPILYVCSNSTRNQVTMGTVTIGDMLSAAGVTWGSFVGGFNLTIVNPNGTTGCNRSSTGLAGTTADYIPHHSFFNYYTSTSNPKHTQPASISEIGNAGPANHQYDIQDFFTAAAAGNLPAVSFLKAPAYQDGHAGYSDPLDEQTFLVNTINFLETLPTWSNTAVIIMYDDSDDGMTTKSGRSLKMCRCLCRQRVEACAKSPWAPELESEPAGSSHPRSALRLASGSAAGIRCVICSWWIRRSMRIAPDGQPSTAQPVSPREPSAARC
jgi:hypothetical protein